MCILCILFYFECINIDNEKEKNYAVECVDTALYSLNCFCFSSKLIYIMQLECKLHNFSCLNTE